MTKSNKEVRIILEKGAKFRQATPGAAGIDLVANVTENVVIHPQHPAVLIPTGVRLDMSEHKDLCAVVLPRSGLGHKKGLVMGNGVGLIDSDYQGEIFVSAWNRNPESISVGMGRQTFGPIVIEPGERLAQLVFLPTLTGQILFHEVESFDGAITKRGAGGFGSTGSKSLKA